MIRFFLLGIVLMLSSLNATTIVYQSFDDLVQKADGIISGTVSELNYRKKKGNIYTYVTLRDITVHNGLYSDSEFTFRMLGGKDGEIVSEVHGSPKFSLDEKVIIFIKGNGRNIMPILGWEQGVFKVKRDDSNEDYILDANNNFVYDIDDNGMIHKQLNNKSKLYILKDQNIIVNQTVKKKMSKLKFIKKIKEKNKQKGLKKTLKSLNIEDDLNNLNLITKSVTTNVNSPKENNHETQDQ